MARIILSTVWRIELMTWEQARAQASSRKLFRDEIRGLERLSATLLFGLEGVACAVDQVHPLAAAIDLHAMLFVGLGVMVVKADSVAAAQIAALFGMKTNAVEVALHRALTMPPAQHVAAIDEGDLHRGVSARGGSLRPHRATRRKAVPAPVPVQRELAMLIGIEPTTS